MWPTQTYVNHSFSAWEFFSAYISCSALLLPPYLITWKHCFWYLLLHWAVAAGLLSENRIDFVMRLLVPRFFETQLELWLLQEETRSRWPQVKHAVPCVHLLSFYPHLPTAVLASGVGPLIRLFIRLQCSFPRSRAPSCSLGRRPCVQPGSPHPHSGTNFNITKTCIRLQNRLVHRITIYIFLP